MRQQHFRHSVVQSNLSLLVVFLFFALICLLPNLYQQERWLSFVWFSVMAYVLVEWNNRFQLLRIRSRMNSVCFLTLVMTQPVFHVFSLSLIPAAALLLCYFFLFFAYAQQAAQGYLFHAFLALSVGSLVYPALLLFVPFLYLGVHRDLNAVSLKNIAAILLALLTPYWLVFPLCLLPQYAQLLDNWKQSWTASFEMFYVARPWEHWWVTMSYDALIYKAVLLGLLLIAVGHFGQTAYSDKLRTRQFYFLLFKNIFPVVFLFLLEHHQTSTASLIFIVAGTPFFAHFFTLARTAWVNVFFVLVGGILLFLTLSNLFALWDEYLVLYQYFVNSNT